jgi:hypothetical protein
MFYRRSHRRRARTCSRSRAARSLRAFWLASSLRCAISLRRSSNATAAVDRPGPGSWVCFGITLNSSSLHWRTTHRKDVRARHPSGGTYFLDSTRRECAHPDAPVDQAPDQPATTPQASPGRQERPPRRPRPKFDCDEFFHAQHSRRPPRTGGSRLSDPVVGTHGSRLALRIAQDAAI